MNKRRFYRLISFVIVLSIILSSIGSNSWVYASSIKSLDDINSDIEIKVTDILPVTLMPPNTPQDWAIAYKDGIGFPGFFHNEVEKKIRERNAFLEKKELFIKGAGRYGYNGKADLYSENRDGSLNIWEIKPASNGYWPLKIDAEKQVKRYADGADNYRLGKNNLIKNDYFICETPKKIKYRVDYKNSLKNDGLIFYRFTRLKRNGREEQEELATEEETEDDKDPVRKITFPIPSPIPGPEPEPEPEPGPKPNPEFDPEVGTIYEPSIFNYVEVGLLLYFSYKAISSSGLSADSVMSTIKAASVDFLERMSICTGKMAKIAMASGTIIFALFSGNTKVSAADQDEYDAIMKEYNDALYDYDTLLKTTLGEDYLEKLGEYYGEDTEYSEQLTRLIQDENGNYEDASNAQPPRDPLIIDLGKKGIDLCTLGEGVNFDLDNNGFAEKTAWIGKEDGFLALDRNGNGRIDNGGELFGDQVDMGNGKKSSSGFEALNLLDDDENKIIDKDDKAFKRLQIWVDSDHNGKSESSELKSLEFYSIKEIHLDQLEKKSVDEATGTMMAEFADVIFEKTDNENTIIGEFWFPINASSTTHGDVVTAGNVPDLKQLLNDDSTGVLHDMLEEFSCSDTSAEKKYWTRKILYYITDADDILINSRGGNIDARNLHVIEQFMGRDFEGVDGTNPNVNAASILNSLYVNIENYYYNILNEYTSFSEYRKCIIQYTKEDGTKVFDPTFLLGMYASLDYDSDFSSVMYDYVSYVNTYDKIEGTNYRNNDYSYTGNINDSLKEASDVYGNANLYIGTTGNDSYSGSSSYDILYGENGNDSFYGYGGNDYISGGNGDDFYDGEAGNDIYVDSEGDDTYVFGKGYGIDTIYDYSGTDTISFSGIASSGIIVNGVNNHDITVTIKGTEDILIIKNFIGEDGHKDYNLMFNDKTIHCTSEESPFRHIYGDEHSNDLRAVLDGSVINAFESNDTILGSKGDDIIYGNEGDDNIYSEEGSDILYGCEGNDCIIGQEGDDYLFGGSGDDFLAGCEGDDYLCGGEGDDTFYFRSGYDRDIVDDENGKTLIDVGENIDAISCFLLGENAVISLNNDYMVVMHYIDNSGNIYLKSDSEEILLSDRLADVCPETISSEEVISITSGLTDSDAIFADSIPNLIAGGGAYDYIVGAEQNDIIFGDSETDRILAGEGNDTILGGNGNDQLFGEDGNDVVSGGQGNDYINASEGDDIIIPDGGCDFIDGGKGNDSYFINEEAENVTIMDNDGDNRILFGENLNSESIKAYRSNWNDLLVTITTNNNDILNLIIKNYCIDENSRGFKFFFEDGNIFNAVDNVSPLRTISDTDNMEYMSSIYKDGIIIVSSDGNDQLIGSDYSDTLIGGKDNNRIIANAGDDYLEGGFGDDYISGGNGNDTFIFKNGYGIDTISDNEGNNSIIITGYNVEDISVYRHNWNDLKIDFKDSDDTIILEGFYVNPNCRNYIISFDNSRFSATDSNSPLRNIIGSADSDYMTGFDDDSFCLKGLDGYDNLNGGNGNDTLDGGNGDDRLLGGEGKDILIGGEGNDYLAGGIDEDSYIFSRGYGDDIVDDPEGISYIKFGDEICYNQILIKRTKWNNITLYLCEDDEISDNSDSICINNYAVSELCRNIKLIFADGTEYDLVLGVDDLVNDEEYRLVLEGDALVISEAAEESIIENEEDIIDTLYIQTDEGSTDETDDE